MTPMKVPDMTNAKAVRTLAPLRRWACWALLSLLAGCGTTPPAPVQPAAGAPATAATAARKLNYSNSWRIEVSEGANSDGEFVFNVTPKGGAPTGSGGIIGN